MDSPWLDQKPQEWGADQGLSMPQSGGWHKTSQYKNVQFSE